jgi:hypothetical protein
LGRIESLRQGTPIFRNFWTNHSGKEQ